MIKHGSGGTYLGLTDRPRRGMSSRFDFGGMSGYYDYCAGDTTVKLIYLLEKIQQEKGRVFKTAAAFQRYLKDL